MALVRTLHERDVVQIGDDITLAVVYVRGGTVRLSIQAPPDQRIDCAGKLTGDHHGHGGDRVDGSGNPRYSGPRHKPICWRAPGTDRPAA